MVPRPSIFDIPHIVDAICDHLEPPDIWRCYRVSRTWRDNFGPYRYRDIQFTYLDSWQTWRILNNAHRIRNLTVDLADAGYFIAASCTQLRKLVCMNMGYISWSSEDEYEDDNPWGSPIGVWKYLESSNNALYLVGKNPRLHTLDISYYIGKDHLNPFTDDILTSLSHHQCLRRIRIDLDFEWVALKALLTHLPISLQELELYISIDFGHEQAHTTIAPLQFSHPKQLRSLSFPSSLVDFADLVLIPLLKHCPLLEHLRIGRVQKTTFESEIIPTLIGHCPNIRSFQHDLGSGDWLRSITTLLEAYPNGLRSLILKYNWFYNSDAILAEDDGALVKALLKYSANTLEVLKLDGKMGPWVNGIVSVLEQCPNLKELRIRGTFLSLDDIVHQTSREASSSWTMDQTTVDWERLSPPLLLLPWVCTKLEDLVLYIEKPQCTSMESSILFTHQVRKPNAMVEEMVISTVLQLGVLLSTLKSLKSLKLQPIFWDQALYDTVRTISFERGVFYMNKIGLTGITLDDILSVGFPWEAIGDRQKTEEAEKLHQVALRERTGLDKRRLEDYYYSGYREAEDLEMDWPFRVDQKKFHKSGKPYSRRSLRSGAEWFETHARQ